MPDVATAIQEGSPEGARGESPENPFTNEALAERAAAAGQRVASDEKLAPAPWLSTADEIASAILTDDGGVSTRSVQEALTAGDPAAQTRIRGLRKALRAR